MVRYTPHKGHTTMFFSNHEIEVNGKEITIKHNGQEAKHTTDLYIGMVIDQKLLRDLRWFNDRGYDGNFLEVCSFEEFDENDDFLIVGFKTEYQSWEWDQECQGFGTCMSRELLDLFSQLSDEIV